MSTDWRNKDTITVPEFAKVMGVCLSTAYDAVRAGEVDVVKVRSKILVCVPPLRRKIDGTKD
jgi:excisionase family DNA binding protein